MNLSAMSAALFPSLGRKDKEEPEQKRRPLTNDDVKRLYERPPSFTDFMPWQEYLPESQCFLLEDGYSVGAMFELTPVGVEACTDEFIENIYNGLYSALTDAVPAEDLSPWTLQVYIQDEEHLEQFYDRVEDYIDPVARDTDFTQEYLKTFRQHIDGITRKGGLFVDTAVTGVPWGGRYRRIRIVLYRRIHPAERDEMMVTPEDELNEVAQKLETSMEGVDLRLRRCGGRDFYEWMLLWFNPNSPLAKNNNPGTLLNTVPYPGDEKLPFGPDLAESMMLSTPYSDLETGVWTFDDLLHTFITVQDMRSKPKIGHFTAARRQGKHVFSLLDRFPPNTIMTMTIVFKRQDLVKNLVQRVNNASIGDSAEAELAKEESKAVLREMAKGDKLFPVIIGFYVQGKDRGELRRNASRINALLAANGLQPIVERSDQLRLDSYIRSMPMVYDVAMDGLADIPKFGSSRRSRLLFNSDTSALFPAYGRSRGTWSPCFKFWNRGGEPLVMDPLTRPDRKNNGHLLLLGPTGSGKSAQLVDLLIQAMATHRPRLFIIEAGKSHYLLAQYFKQLGLSVNQITMTPNTDVSLPPFADALRILDKPGQRPTEDDYYADSDEGAGDLDLDEDDEMEDRDILGEMEIAARIMITGGDDREDARLIRADRFLIRDAIYHAAETVDKAGRDQVLTEDVVEALRCIGRGELKKDMPEHRRYKATEMADSMDLFCSGMAGHFFNRPGQSWPEADVTILELGILAREGYRDQMELAYVSLMNRINDVVERNQTDERMTIVATDEGHIITTDRQLAAYVVKITKMWRKYGAWFWIATQNMEDFPDAAKKMLNMIEWWLCLVMPKEEVDQIARFKDLTPEQRYMLLSAHKEPGKYTEGVVISSALQTLFRSIPPAISLALAMTEKEEKAERAGIMRKRGCTELEAAFVVAERIEAKRG